MKTPIPIFYERRKNAIPFNFSDRRLSDRRKDNKSMVLDRRRLVSQVRRYERESIQIAISLHMDGEEASGYTENISIGGLLIRSNVAINVGTPLSLQLCFGEHVCHINLIGQVVFCHIAESKEYKDWIIGIKFTAIRDSDEKILTTAIQLLNQNIATRGKSLLHIITTEDSVTQESVNSNAQIAQPSQVGRNSYGLPNKLSKATNHGTYRKLSEKENQNNGIYADVTLPDSQKRKITTEVINVSESGFCFKLPIHEGEIFLGASLEEVTISNGYRKYRTTAEVTNIKKIEQGASKYYKIEAQFKTDLSKPVTDIFRKLDFKLRQPRYGIEPTTQLKGRVVLKLVNGGSLTGIILNFSKYGIAFELEDPLSQKIGDSTQIQEVDLIIDDIKFYSGKVNLIYLKNGNEYQKLKIGISLKDGWLDIDRIFGIKVGNDVKADIAVFFPAIKIFEQVNTEFKAEVGDLRYFMEKVKKKLDEYELQIQRKNLESKTFGENSIFSAAEKEISEYLNFSLKRINHLTKDISPERSESHKKYFQEHLHHLFLLSPFLNRAYSKPRGYAGDYKVVNMLLQNDYEGESIFAKLLTKHACNLPVAQAHRNRIKYLANKINAIVDRQLDSKQCVRIASVGCGPSEEITEFIRANQKSKDCEITLIDFDHEPLYYAQERITQLKILNQNDVRVKIINKSVRDLIKDAKSMQNPLSNHDLIYCAGLFDYLTSSSCARLTKVFYDCLNIGGDLIITNVTDSNDYRMFMEFALEWYIYHRNEADMREIMVDLPQHLKSHFEFEETGTNIFLNIEKQL